MDFGQLVFLAVVQGVTEFLPISSSAHLILGAQAIGAGRSFQQGALIDVALHLGSLFAVLIYFWRDVRSAFIGGFTLFFDLAAGRALRWESRLALLLVLATIPLVLAGVLLLSTEILQAIRDESSLLGLKVIGWTTLGFGLLLYLADRFAPATRTAESWTWRGALFMGVAQAFALIPGTSRSGVTMTAARMLGFERSDAARLALLMAIPAILAASAQGGLELYEIGDVELTEDAAIAAGLSFVSAYAALFLMMRWLRRASFTPFVVYRILLGAALLSYAYSAG